MTDYSTLTPEAKEALVVKAKNVGYSTETLYGNCIQSTLHGIYRAFPDFGVTEDMLRGCFGLAGGCGCCLDYLHTQTSVCLALYLITEEGAQLRQPALCREIALVQVHTTVIQAIDGAFVTYLALYGRGDIVLDTCCHNTLKITLLVCLLR